MTPGNLIAFLAVILTGVTVFARAEVMRPRVKSTYQAAPLVRWLMDSVAFACVPVAFELYAGERLPLGVIFFLVMCAVASTAMLISMRVHDGRDTVREKVVEARHEDAAVVRQAVEETVPVAIDAAIPAVLKDLASQPDPYEPH